MPGAAAMGSEDRDRCEPVVVAGPKIATAVS